MSEPVPLVTIVTPSFNQAEYLEEQDYPAIEYLVVDGGSTDGSVEIIERHAGELAWWSSEVDTGQAEAINKGLARARGEVVAWLNSDDVYRPGAVWGAVAALATHPAAGLVYGDVEFIDGEGRKIGKNSYQQYSLEDLLAFRIIGQPSVFMRAQVARRVGALNSAYHFLLDQQMWIRMARLAEMVYVPAVWSAARQHDAAKNVAQAAAFAEDVDRILAWAMGEPDLKARIVAQRGKVLGGAERLRGRYLLDGGQPRAALRAYGRALRNDPGWALRHWHRILFASWRAVVGGADA
jgi:glycosyltransferase involved in cell wall biosynthesis